MPAQHAIICPDAIWVGKDEYYALITVVNDTISIQPVGAPPPYSDLSILFDADDRIAINDLLQASGQSNPPDLSTPDLTQRLVALEDKVARHAENTRVRTAHLHQRIIDIDKTAGKRIYALEEGHRKTNDILEGPVAQTAAGLIADVAGLKSTVDHLDDSTAVSIARLIERLDLLEYRDRQGIIDAARYDANIAQWLNDLRAEHTEVHDATPPNP